MFTFLPYRYKIKSFRSALLSYSIKEKAQGIWVFILCAGVSGWLWALNSRWQQAG